MTITSKIVATGSYLPEKFLTNSDLTKIVDTSDQWIVERTGIKKRHIVKEGELTSHIAYKAVEKLLTSSSVKVDEIEMIILATTTPDLTFPSTAVIVQKMLNAKKAFAFDIQAVCSGFVYALSVAHNFIKSGQVKNVLVIGADTLSRIVDWKDRNTCVLFGDGAGCVLLEAEKIVNSKRGIIATELYSDGSLENILKTDSGTSLNQKSGFIQMIGKEVFKHAVSKMTESVFKILEKSNLTTQDINFLIPHQANSRILNAVADRLGIEKSKVVITVENHANTSAASIPLALDQINSQGLIKENDLIILEALGAGLTWGAISLRW
jgi:3-oxoacyl-[acyl-carrier-protein] synthase-3